MRAEELGLKVLGFVLFGGWGSGIGHRLAGVATRDKRGEQHRHADANDNGRTARYKQANKPR